MTANAIEVNKVSKVYKLYDTPAHRLKELIFRRPCHKEFVALDEVSFTVERGSVVGIIGDNGAGKSTLLKILSRTLVPTKGTFTVAGITSSLLELGSGFHPEFTGIENIHLYGSLLGIESSRMKTKIDDIIDFSGLGDFIYYPVKTYSSGMYVRLAFSVATAVDPDVLIIDEALSVGDQYFQKKCLDRMTEFKEQEKTIIFCSHDMYPIKTFCMRALWLEHGRIRMDGNAKDVADSYMGYEQMKAELYKSEAMSLERVAQGTFLVIRDFTATQSSPHTLALTFTIVSLEPFPGHIGWAMLRKDRLQVSFRTTRMDGSPPIVFHGTHRVSITVTGINVVNDLYHVYVGILDREAIKPIAVEAVECPVHTGYEIHRSLCHFDTAFKVD